MSVPALGYACMLVGGVGGCMHVCTHAFVPACIYAEECGDECYMICLWVKRRCRVSMREMMCETRRGKGCLGFFFFRFAQ